MDDDKFKAELLIRLDRIQVLLSRLRCVSGDSGVMPLEDTASRQLIGAEQANLPSAAERCLMQEEMQEDYQQALRRWKAGKV